MAIEAYIRQQILINISFDYDLLLIWHNTGQYYWKNMVFALHMKYEIFIAPGTNIEYTETTCNKDMCIVYHHFFKWHSH